MTEERFLTIKSQIRQLMEQDGFFEAANAARTTSETMKLLTDNGIEMTAEEIEGFAKLGGELAQQIREADELSDEMLADCVGLLAAFGRYDPRLARRVLGICGGGVLPGGRLRHYVPEEALPAAVHRACFWIDALSHTVSLAPIRPGETFEPFFPPEAGKTELTLPE